MGQEPHKDEVQCLAPGQEQPQESAHTGDQSHRTQLCSKGRGVLVDHGPAVCSCGKESQWCSGQHRTELPAGQGL